MSKALEEAYADVKRVVSVEMLDFIHARKARSDVSNRSRNAVRIAFEAVDKERASKLTLDA